MTSSVAAPIAAAAAAVLAAYAVAGRQRALPSDLAVHRPTVDALARIGRLRSIRWLADADRVRTSLAASRSVRDADRTVGTAAAAAAACVGSSILLRGPAILLGPILALASLRAPIFVIGREAKRRQRAVERDVPLLLDVLSLASFAGLPAPAALRRAVSVIDGPLADELSAALRDVELGARWRDRLGELADAVPAPDLRRTITVLRRTDAIGAATSEPISILADEVRAARRAAASERARKAPVQMLFPLVFLVLPAFLLLTVVPVLVATLGSIR